MENNKRNAYLRDIRKAEAALLKIEQQWLASINAPVKRIPLKVRSAVFSRFLLRHFVAKLPPDEQDRLKRYIVEYIISQRIIKQALEQQKGGDDNDEGQDQDRHEQKD